jgi:hypothetical protein
MISRCDRQQQALSIVTAALAAPSSHLSPDCRQEALACMRRLTLFSLSKMLQCLRQCAFIAFIFLQAEGSNLFLLPEQQRLR